MAIRKPLKRGSKLFLKFYLLLCFFMPVAVYAQEAEMPTYQIRGRVLGPDGQAIKE